MHTEHDAQTLDAYIILVMEFLGVTNPTPLKENLVLETQKDRKIAEGILP